MSLLGPVSTLRRHRDAAFEADFLAGAPPAGMNFSRPAAASYWDSAGVHRVAASNEPRFDFDPISLRPRGLLLEPASTNYFTWSNDFTVSAWTFAGATRTPGFAAPNGKPEAVVFTGTSNGPSMRSWTIPRAGRAAFSVYVNPMGNTQTRPFLIRNGTTATNLSQGIFDPATGTIATSVGAGEWRAERLPNGWWRISASANAAFAVGDTAVFYFGFTTGSISNMPAMACWGGQAELGNVTTSLIPTTNVAAARSVDSAIFGAWWYDAAVGGTLLADFTPGPLQEGTGLSPRIAVLDNGSTANRAGIYLANSANVAQSIAVVDGTGLYNRSSASIAAASGANLVAFAFGQEGGSSRINGALLGADITSPILPNGISRLEISPASGRPFHIRGVRYYKSRKDLAQITAR